MSTLKSIALMIETLKLGVINITPALINVNGNVYSQFADKIMLPSSPIYILFVRVDTN